MVLDFLQIIDLFAALLLLLLGTVFIFYPVGRKISNFMLAAFLFSNFILLSSFFAYLTFPNYPHKFPFINHMVSYSYLLLAPFLYLYIVSLCNSKFKFSAITTLHLLPYLIFTVLSFFIDNYSAIIGVEPAIIWNYYYKIYINSLDLQIAVYIILSFRKLKSYRSALHDNYSNIAKIDLKWVNLVLYCLIFMWLTDLSNRMLWLFHRNTNQISHYLQIQSVSIDLILSICLIYKGMRQASVPSGISPQPKYSQSKIEANIYEENKILLNQIMENEKPYLLPELNLDELAKMLNKPPKQLSQTINLGFSMNFNTYINRYRINEAKRIIELDVNDKKTIYEILLDAGFNSKSVFNDAFKKHAGCTPKEYRRLIKLQTAQ